MMNDNESESASVLDRLYSALRALHDTDNDLIPESERTKIAAAAVHLMLAVHALCGDTPEEIDATLEENIDA